MFPSRSSAALAAFVASLVAAPLAHGATLSVDDDGSECPAAPYASIQAAVDAADPGDTVAVCPGTYAEGTGEVATNALTIAKSLTLKGAGADLVTIRPAGSGQIAEGGTPDLRNGIGDIVVVRGTPSAPVTVNISGVTIDGAGVAAEAGLVFLDAQGSVVRSRVTNVVTSEAANASTQPGGYRSAMPGVGIAQVTAAASAPDGAAPRPLLIDHTRVDRYNRIGVLIDGATETTDSAPLTATGIVNRLTMRGSQVVGRTLCVNYQADGNCSSVNLLTTGPLFGQDGVRVTSGSTAAVTTSLISQNLVNGTGAPTRNAATNNANLTRGAGLRFVDAGSSSVTRSNVVDNAYGVLNVTADQTTANTATPVDATDTWWGLRYNSATNPGPAISPTVNPPVPENPVNGAPTADGDGTTSTAVDVFPFRSGPQGDPTTGEHPLLIAPLAAADLAPTVALASTPAGDYSPGGTLTLRATATDDFGVRRVVFYEGAEVVGEVAHPPYEATIALPPGTCAPRGFSAVAEDFLGQTAAGALEVTGRCEPGPEPGGGGGATPPAPSTDGGGATTQAPSAGRPAPTVALVGPPARIGARGRTLTFDPKADAGVARIDVFLGTRLVCSVASEPWTCDLKPTGADVGRQTLRVVVTDNAGATGETSAPVTVDRFAPRGLRVAMASKRARRGLARRTFSGAVRLPEGVTPAQGCAGASVTLVVRRGGRAVDNTQVRLDDRCRFARRLTTRRKGKPFSVTATFGGTAVLAPISKTRRFS